MIQNLANKLVLLLLAGILCILGSILYILIVLPQSSNTPESSPVANQMHNPPGLASGSQPSNIDYQGSDSGTQPKSPFTVLAEDLGKDSISVQHSESTENTEMERASLAEADLVGEEKSPAQSLVTSSEIHQWKDPAIWIQNGDYMAESTTITGRVVDDDGQGIGGHILLVSSALPNSSENMVRTDGSGRFHVGSIAPGDYMLRTQEHPFYSVGTARVRSGGLPVTLKLYTFSGTSLQGMVTDEHQQPLSGVLVIPPEQSEAVSTDQDGQFSLRISALAGRGVSLRFQAEGYLNARLHVSAQDRGTDKSRNLQVTMRRGEFEMAGTIHDEVGQPLVSALVQVRSRSAKLHKTAKTDEYGRFLLTHLVAASDYVFKATSTRDYQAHIVENMTIHEGMEEPGIVLPLAASGTVEGRILDTQGNPVPQLSLLAISENGTGKTTTVVSDDSGFYKLEDFVAGAVSMRTRTAPAVLVTGLKLDPSTYSSHDLLIDIGSSQLAGSLIDKNGVGIADASVKMLFEHQGPGGVSSQTSRIQSSNPQGQFAFTGIGSGERTLVITAEGYHRKTIDLDTTLNPGPHQIILEQKRRIM